MQNVLDENLLKVYDYKIQPHDVGTTLSRVCHGQNVLCRDAISS